MKYSLIFILSLFSTFLFSQTNIDSLEALLPHKKEIEKAKTLNDISYAYWGVAPEKGIEYGNQAYELATQLDSKEDIGRALGNIAINQWAKSEFNQALENNHKALKIYEELNYLEGISVICNNLGTAYLDIFDYENALKYDFKALKIAQEHGFNDVYILTLSNISSIYLEQKNYTKAQEYIQEAIQVSEKENIKVNIASQHTTLGEIYKLQEDYNKALTSYKKALSIFKKNENNYGTAISLYNIGDTEYHLKNYNSASKYFEESLILSQKINDQVGVLLANKGIGQVYKEQKKYDEALLHYDIALRLANKLKAKEDKLGIYIVFAELYKSMGSYDKSLQYLEKHNLLKDSIQDETSSKQIAEMQTKYDSERKEKENELLRKNNEIQELAIAKQTSLSNTFIGVSILILLMGFILLSRFAIKKKANKLLIQKNEVISNQRDELKQINSTKDKFFSIISHDLRSPFSNILGFTNLLVEDYDTFDDAEKKDIIIQLNKSAKTTFELLANLLTWSQTQTGQIEINKENLNLKELIDTSCAPYVSIAVQKNIDITCKVPQESTIYIDKNTASVFISNIINNAIKFTPQGGKIIVDYIENEDTIELHIIDTGVGMSQDTLDKLFKIEEHISTKGTNNEEGTGLGLILSKEFIQKNGGTITVTSQVGKGSHFIISLPKAS
ncbi:tetratricopeptide repeat-containing sensor histidine kinase [uncultured Flavobacterium sp.]|uniref:ATP-binding protein n=1 Tax=uncultured Flavobacterium sp. TaxID=165435 RepID=UPI0030EDED14|tara:strand:+ start:46004 stop:48022 length:2019 start_codon:yes stop_codon:yes gene_type:complete